MLTLSLGTNLSILLHDALIIAKDDILTHPLDPEEIEELMEELL